MAKHNKTLDQIQRLNAGLHWTKVEKLLKSYGAEVYEGSGSTVTFVVDEVNLTADRPHPRKDVREGTREAGARVSEDDW
jgi:hypothetical protein